MVSRSLIDVFVLMRNNAIRNRLISCDQECNENVSLVALHNVEEGVVRRRDTALPPLWLDRIEEMQYLLTTLRMRINELKTAYSNELHRPSFDETHNRNHKSQIEKLTKEISVNFTKAHSQIQIIHNFSNQTSNNDRVLIENIFKSMVKTLQDMTALYRSVQSDYIRELNTREKRSKFDFEDVLLSHPKNSMSHFQHSNDEHESVFNNVKEQEQLLLFEETGTREAIERHQEVCNIVKTVEELGEIFNEIAYMVSDQGTVLDRIDYNIEQTEGQVSEGFKQLQKAHRHKTKKRKMCLMCGLGASIIVIFYFLMDQLSS